MSQFLKYITSISLNNKKIVDEKHVEILIMNQRLLVVDEVDKFVSELTDGRVKVLHQSTGKIFKTFDRGNGDTVIVTDKGEIYNIHKDIDEDFEEVEEAELTAK